MAVQRALLSVFDKTGILEFAKRLAALKIEILSTGGTSKLLREAVRRRRHRQAHTLQLQRISPEKNQRPAKAKKLPRSRVRRRSSGRPRKTKSPG